MGKSYADNAYKDLVYKHPDWKNTVDQYETQFAKNLFNTNYVQEAARTTLLKLSGMLTAYYNVKDNKEKLQNDETKALADIAGKLSGQGMENRPELQDALLPWDGRTSADGAGQVGNAKFFVKERGEASPEAMQTAERVNAANLDAVINGDGNLRERMTMLYNGLFINGGKNKADIAGSRSLKNMLLNITPEDLGQMRMAGAMAGNRDVSGAQVRFDLLDEMRHYHSKNDLFDTYTVARDLKRGEDKMEGSKGPVRRWWEGVKRGFLAAISSKFTRKSIAKNKRVGLGLQHYNDLGLELSQRERANALDGQGRLQWLEGQANYRMRKPMTADGMLQIAGPSGTTLRMLGAYKLLGATKQELLNFRLALIAWMVTSKDHSIYEILKGSHNAGVKGYEDISEAANMYKTIDPLSEQEIRAMVPENRFPHETIYLKMLNEIRDKRRKYIEEIKNKTIDDDATGTIFKPAREGVHGVRPVVDAGSRYDAMNYDAADMAWNIYSGDMYKIMNTSQKYGSYIGHKAMEKLDIEIFRKYELGSKDVADGLYNAARLSARFAMDGLEDRSSQESSREGIEQLDMSKIYGKANTPQEEAEKQAYRESFLNRKQAYRGIAYRGGKAEKGFRQEGSLLTFNSLTSTSMSIAAASSFYKSAAANRDNKTLVRMRMTGEGAVSIADVSRYKWEYEVLVSPGSQFRVSRAIQTAYINKDQTKVKFENEMTAEEKERFENDGAVYLLKEDGKAEDHLNGKTWSRVQLVELEEVRGAGGDKRRRQDAEKEERKAARNRLLNGRRAAQEAV